MLWREKMAWCRSSVLLAHVVKGQRAKSNWTAKLRQYFFIFCIQIGWVGGICAQERPSYLAVYTTTLSF
ncbi:hypothetical protein BC832DRAFT_551956 [Gaertneriomyces semiglobifer]|nr:hypothetical protein BC832DRAFT_551956 [Gaertneriomyces semiglobifer]